MREIKFRAWDGKRMTTSGIMFNSSTGVLLTPDGARMKLMQYTGLKDKNGKEIFEGDQRENGDVIVYSVAWAKFGWTDGGYLLDIDPSTDEVIGNIYEDENKNLIE